MEILGPEVGPILMGYTPLKHQLTNKGGPPLMSSTYRVKGSPPLESINLHIEGGSTPRYPQHIE